jgi:hypothetical protein
LFKQSFLDGIEKMADIMGTAKDEGTQLKAATYIVERVAGKIPDKVEISADTKPWQGVVESAEFEDDFEDPTQSVPDQGELESRKTSM